MRKQGTTLKHWFFHFPRFPPLSGSMPTDYELYYGFTRFAIELNELCPELKDVLPRTDARFRPDQRYNTEFTTASLLLLRHAKQGHRFPTKHISGFVICSLFLECLVKSGVCVRQAPGGGELGDGFLREAAHRGPAENQEKVERGEWHQTGAVLL